MPKMNDIHTAVYKLLSEDEILMGLCTVYKGGRRPSHSVNPSATVEVKHLDRGEGEGIWMCDIVITVFSDSLTNGQPDHVQLSDIVNRMYNILTDYEIELNDAKALPIIAGESSGPVWSGHHTQEVSQECVYGLVFVCYN
ncbi:MAG: hypothetical protein JXB48_11955 [Candidatus Latescibacteria bacterium]|nr:hypothetical protein [Candidatus Latescibacterota bacterium]